MDRVDAGRRLAGALRGRIEGGGVVLGIPRGGVIVAAEVASALGAGLDVVVPRKIGAPQNPELAIGAVAAGVQVWDRDLIRRLRVSERYLGQTVAREEAEIARRTRAYRGARPSPSLEGRTAVVVDDGVATGATAEASLRWARACGAAHVVLAVPVGPPETIDRLAAVADAVVVLETPPAFRAVGEWYGRFDQTTDAEVLAALAGAGGSG